MIYLITYEKNVFKEKNPAIEEEIMKLGSYWWHHINDVWLVQTHLNSKQIFDKICPLFSKIDRIYITRISNDYYGHLHKDAWTWIQEAFNREQGMPRVL